MFHGPVTHFHPQSGVECIPMCCWPSTPVSSQFKGVFSVAVCIEFVQVAAESGGPSQAQVQFGKAQHASVTVESGNNCMCKLVTCGNVSKAEGRKLEMTVEHKPSNILNVGSCLTCLAQCLGCSVSTCICSCCFTSVEWNIQF